MKVELTEKTVQTLEEMASMYAAEKISDVILDSIRAFKMILEANASGGQVIFEMPGKDMGADPGGTLIRNVLEIKTKADVSKDIQRSEKCL